MIHNVYWLSCKEAVILVRFEWRLNFLDRFFEKCLNVRWAKHLFRIEEMHTDAKSPANLTTLKKKKTRCNSIQIFIYC